MIVLGYRRVDAEYQNARMNIHRQRDEDSDRANDNGLHIIIESL